jgi:hypothetical protein
MVVVFIITLSTCQQHTVVQGSRTGGYYHDWWHTLQAQDGTSVHSIVVICRRIHEQWSMHFGLLRTATSNGNYST